MASNCICVFAMDFFRKSHSMTVSKLAYVFSEWHIFCRIRGWPKDLRIKVHKRSLKTNTLKTLISAEKHLQSLMKKLEILAHKIDTSINTSVRPHIGPPNNVGHPWKWRVLKRLALIFRLRFSTNQYRIRLRVSICDLVPGAPLF